MVEVTHTVDGTTLDDRRRAHLRLRPGPGGARSARGGASTPSTRTGSTATSGRSGRPRSDRYPSLHGPAARLLREGPPRRRGPAAQAPRPAGVVHRHARGRLRGASPTSELAAKTVEFRQRFENGETLDELLFEAFAAVREAFKRTMDVRLFDVQLMGGIVLHEGDIAEMKTGEGKTFVATQALYLNALAGHGTHLVTVNDYLATARPGVDAARLRSARDAHRVHREHDAVRAAPRGVSGRRHLRDELRVRLRLPARQHGRLARRHRPARPPLRDRGRGRLDPHRRGAHAADHLRRARDGGAALLRLRAHRAAAGRAPSRIPATRRARPRPPAPTTSSTRSTRRSPSPSRASRRSSARCGSRTSTRRRTRSSSTTSSRR